MVNRGHETRFKLYGLCDDFATHNCAFCILVLNRIGLVFSKNFISKMEHLVSTTNHAQNDYFNEANATFGDRLAAARQAKGLDVDGLSEKLGVDVGTVKIWERDADMPHANRIQMLAGLLNVSMVWLVSGEGNGTSEVADTFERPEGVNDALGEISQLKATLSGAVEKLDKLQERLLSIP